METRHGLTEWDDNMKRGRKKPMSKNKVEERELFEQLNPPQQSNVVHLAKAAAVLIQL